MVRPQEELLDKDLEEDLLVLEADLDSDDETVRLDVLYSSALFVARNMAEEKVVVLGWSRYLLDLVDDNDLLFLEGVLVSSIDELGLVALS